MLPIDLNLRFGKEVPADAINLAYVPIPELTPDTGVLVASHIGKMDVNTADYYTANMAGSPAVTSITYSCPSTGSGASPIVNNGTQIKIFSAPIAVDSVEKTASDSWMVKLKDGVIQHQITYNIATTGDYDSWLHNIGFTESKQLMAFYTLQETAFCKRDTYDASYPQARLQNKAYKEKVYITGVNTLQTIRPSIYNIEELSINDRVILGSSVFYKTTDNSSTLRGGLISAVGAAAIVDVSNGEITLTGIQVYVGDEVTASYVYNTSLLTYRGFEESVEVSGGTKRIYRDLNLNPAYGQTFDGGQPTSDLTQQSTSLYLLPSAVYDLEHARNTGQIILYRAVDYGEFSLLRWTSKPIQTHYEVAGFLPWDSKISTSLSINVVPPSGSIDVGTSMDFACTVSGTNKPIVTVAMDTLGGTINPGTVTNIVRTGNTTKWTYNAPNISSAAGVPYNINVRWEKVGTQNGVSALKQIVVPVTVTSSIGVSLLSSSPGSGVGRFSSHIVTPYITGGYKEDCDLVWAIYNGSSLSTAHGSVYPEDPLNPGERMPEADLARWGFSTTYSFAGITTIKGPAHATVPDANGYPVTKQLRMLYTPPSSPDGGTTKWGYAIKLRAYSHADIRRYGELDLLVTSGISVTVNPTKVRVQTGTTKALNVEVDGVNLAAGDSGLVSWSCTGVNATGGALAVTDPTLFSGPSVLTTGVSSVYNFTVPATSGVYTLKATSLTDSEATFTVTLSGVANEVVNIIAVTGLSVPRVILPDVYGLEPAHHLQVTATIAGVTGGAIGFALYNDEALTVPATSAAYGTITATGNPETDVFTCNVRLPDSFMTSGVAAFYLKAYATEMPDAFDSINMFGNTNIYWSYSPTGNYNCAVPYSTVLTLVNIGTAVSGIFSMNGTPISAATSAWAGGPPSVEILTPTINTTGGTFGKVTIVKYPIRINTPFSSAGLDRYALTMSVSGIPSGVVWSSGRTTKLNSLTTNIVPLVSNWRVTQNSATGYLAPDGSGGYVLKPNATLNLGAQVSVGGNSIPSYYTGYDINYDAVSGVAWSVDDATHAATGILTQTVTGALYTAPSYETTFKQQTGTSWYKVEIDTIQAKPAAVTPAKQQTTNWPIRIDSTVRSVAINPADELSRILIGEGLSPGDTVTLVATVYCEGSTIANSGCIWSTEGLNGTITNTDDSAYVTGTAKSSVKFTVPADFPTTTEVTDTVIASSAADTDIYAQILIPINFDFGIAEIVPNPNVRVGKYDEAIYGTHRFSD